MASLVVLPVGGLLAAALMTISVIDSTFDDSWSSSILISSFDD